MWNPKHDTNEFIQSRKRLTNTENRLVVTKGKVDRGGKDWA